MSTDAKINGAPEASKNPTAESIKGQLWGTTKLPEAWATPAASALGGKRKAAAAAPKPSGSAATSFVRVAPPSVPTAKVPGPGPVVAAANALSTKKPTPSHVPPRPTAHTNAPSCGPAPPTGSTTAARPNAVRTSAVPTSNAAPTAPTAVPPSVPPAVPSAAADVKKSVDKKKNEKNIKVENSPFVLYPSNGLLAAASAAAAWSGMQQGAGTAAALNGLGSFPSALPTIPFQSLPQLKASGNANMAQAMRMLNTYHQSGMMGFQNAAAGMFGGTMKRFNRTPVACVVCHKAKSTCDSNRPCARCSRLGKAHLCKDRPHKKKGRPPKKRTSSEISSNIENPKIKRSVLSKPEKVSPSEQAAANKTGLGGNGMLNSVFQNRMNASAPTSHAAARRVSAGLKAGPVVPKMGSNSTAKEANMIASSHKTKGIPAYKPKLTPGLSMQGGMPKQKDSKANSKSRPEKRNLGSKIQGEALTPTKGSGDEFSSVAGSVDQYLWEEVVDDMSSFFIKHPEILSTELAALYAGASSRNRGSPIQRSVMDLPAGCQVLSPLFCMYLSYMSYYLEPAQFTALQLRMAKLGVIIPNLDDCPIRKFDKSVAKSIGSKIKAIAPVFRFRWCRKKPSVGLNKDLNFPMATLKVSFYRSKNPRTFLLYICVNEEFENLFGYKQSEVVRMSNKPFYYKLIHPKDWKKQLSLEMSMLLNKRRRFNTFIQCMCKWKEEICCLETFQFHFNNQDLMTHFTITFSPLPKYLFEEERSSAVPRTSQATTHNANSVKPQTSAPSKISKFSADNLVRSISDSLKTERSAGPKLTRPESKTSVKQEKMAQSYSHSQGLL
mmetsp:Transcript_2504/g.5704  ORF Transcript_2504/g.5704 Transcript_2504/m.5704 type:complete len:833 (-) Transcript_2504:75-2573(-)